MKNFAVKSMLFITTAVLMILILNSLYKNTQFWKYHDLHIAKFSDVPQGIQLANLGSSHGLNGFDYTGVPYKTFNFALSSQTLLLDYSVLRQYIDHFERDAVLLILVDYFEITQIKIDFSDIIAHYYRFLDKEFIPGYSRYDSVRYNIVPVLSAGGNLVKIVLDLEYFETERTKNSLKTTDAAELADICPKRYRFLTALESGSGFATAPDAGEEGFAYNKALVSKIIELCMEHHIRPALVSTPITSVLNTVYAENSPGFFDTFYRFFRELQEDYPSVPYFDYSHDPRFENNFSLFGDGDHLNGKGAEKFTGVVVSDLQASGLLGE